MENTEQDIDRRVQLVFRRRNEGASTSYELKTENFDNDEQFGLEALSIIQNTLEEDREFLADRGSDE